MRLSHPARGRRAKSLLLLDAYILTQLFEGGLDNPCMPSGQDFLDAIDPYIKPSLPAAAPAEEALGPAHPYPGWMSPRRPDSASHAALLPWVDDDLREDKRTEGSDDEPPHFFEGMLGGTSLVDHAHRHGGCHRRPHPCSLESGSGGEDGRRRAGGDERRRHRCRAGNGLWLAARQRWHVTQRFRVGRAPRPRRGRLADRSWTPDTGSIAGVGTTLLALPDAAAMAAAGTAVSGAESLVDAGHWLGSTAANVHRANHYAHLDGIDTFAKGSGPQDLADYDDEREAAVARAKREHPERFDPSYNNPTYGQWLAQVQRQLAAMPINKRK